MNDADFARHALKLLDLTDLSDTCREDQIEQLIQKAITPHGPVAAICIWPSFVSMAASRLEGKGVRIATVINFPKGGDDVERAISDTEEAVSDGADEIDLVMPYKSFLAGDEPITRSMIAEVKDSLPDDVLLKVILETGLYPDQEAIARASHLAIEEGADFIKTSTGKAAIAATPEAARTMLGVIKATGGTVGFKPAGGIRTLADARLYLGLAEEILGAHYADARHFRFGASDVYDALMAAITGGNATKTDAAY
jgi:deoxyribose-phosphate aldolase